MRPLRESLALLLHTPRLWALQLGGNMVIFVLYAGWLRLPEAHWWDLLLNLIVVLLAVAGALVLHGGTLNYLSEAHADRSALLTPNFKKALKNFLAIAIWALIFVFVCSETGKLGDYSYSFPGYLRSELPNWLRKYTTDAAFTGIYNFIAGFLLWIVMPGLLLPGALLAARHGFRGLMQLEKWRGMFRHVSYWVVLLLAIVPAGIVIVLLLDWRLNPATATLRGEEISLILRLAACYVIGLLTWLWVGSILGKTYVLGEKKEG